MGWKIIDIESDCHLKLFLNNLLIYRADQKISIPISEIDTIIIDEFKTTFSLQLLNEFSANNILTILCDKKHMPSSLVLPCCGNYNTLKVIEQQINWSNSWKSEKWKEIIILKIESQIAVLKHLNFDKWNELEHLQMEVKNFDITNREGHAAKIYWHSLFGNSFSRNDENSINLILNYGYGLLRSYFSRSIVKKGLDPRISIFHKSFSNHFALASDLMELFRFIVDTYTFKLFQREIDPCLYKIKEEMLNLFNYKINIDGKNQTINNAIDIYIDSVIKQTSIPIMIFDYDQF